MAKCFWCDVKKIKETRDHIIPKYLIKRFVHSSLRYLLPNNNVVKACSICNNERSRVLVRNKYNFELTYKWNSIHFCKGFCDLIIWNDTDNWIEQIKIKLWNQLPPLKRSLQ